MTLESKANNIACKLITGISICYMIQKKAHTNYKHDGVVQYVLIFERIQSDVARYKED